ncbi:hypothetical protein GGR95_000076 [Sulfitobacter undariae]|uniref:DUF5666 domain-containing protein n=1 Tax=Sulfitobacter undariae TaxID=1563671 RepID=A0A7W6E4C0_9RHOB|nr:hypothetical protein [Sulfitobacter undariae]MBB3992457.1 hypothetical protein [Sulfitobacter undariae]
MRLLTFLIFVGLAYQAHAQDAPRLAVFGVVETVNPLVVAGREILLPEGVRILSPLGPSGAVQLGDTLAIAATLSNGTLVATRVLEVFPIVGPVATVTEGTATVMGTAVHVPPKAVVKKRQWVAVSGLWSGEKVITTNLRSVDWDGYGQLAGAIDRVEGTEPVKIGGTTINGARVPQDGFGNDIWTFSGAPEGTALGMRLMSKGVFGGKVDLTLWQGYASLPIASQTYMIHGSGIIGTAKDASMPQAGSLITRCVLDGRVVYAAPIGLEAAYDALGCATTLPAD